MSSNNTGKYAPDIQFKANTDAVLQKQQVEQFIRSVENTNIKIEFDPHKKDEIQQCILDMQAAIDEKSADFKTNRLVQQKSKEIKQYFKSQILKNAELARVHTQGSA